MKIELEFSPETVSQLAKLKELFENATATDVKLRAKSTVFLAEYCLMFGISESIRRMEKTAKDRNDKVEREAKAAFADKMVACNGDVKKIQALLAEMAKK